MSLLTLPVSLDTYKNLTPGFLLLSNYLLLSSNPFLLLPFIQPTPPRHDWDDECYLHFAASRTAYTRELAHELVLQHIDQDPSLESLRELYEQDLAKPELDIITVTDLKLLIIQDPKIHYDLLHFCPHMR